MSIVCVIVKIQFDNTLVSAQYYSPSARSLRSFMPPPNAPSCPPNAPSCPPPFKNFWIRPCLAV